MYVWKIYPDTCTVNGILLHGTRDTFLGAYTYCCASFVKVAMDEIVTGLELKSLFSQTIANVFYINFLFYKKPKVIYTRSV